MGSSYKRITLYIEGISQSRKETVRHAANEQWRFQIWNQYGSHVFASGEGFFDPHEKEELADRLSWAIWAANQAYCAVEIQEACVEIRPQHTYRRDQSDYDRLWVDHFPIKNQLRKILKPSRFIGTLPRGF